MVKSTVYKTIFASVEEAIFQRQVKSVEECSDYVKWQTGIQHLDVLEIKRIMHRVCTQYK